jgi:hypothetical protein
MNIIYTFGTDDVSSEMNLEYELYDNEFTRKWFAYYLETLSKKSNFIGSPSFFGHPFENFTQIEKQINTFVSTINNHLKNYSNQKQFLLEGGLSLQLLGEIHTWFTELDGDSEFCNSNIKVPFLLKNLHLLIHKAESVVPEAQHIGCFVDVSLTGEERDKGPDLEESDHEHFSSDYLWGDLFVGYGKLGVPTLHAFYTDSKPKPQTWFNSDTMLSFYNDNILEGEYREQAKKWLVENHQIDIDNAKSSVGNLKIGKLITTVSDQQDFVSRLSTHRKLINIEVSRKA